MRRPDTALLFASMVALASTAPAMAIDEAHIRVGERVIERAIGYLRAQQDAATGGWSVSERGPALPAITGLVVHGMLLDPRIDDTDPAVRRGMEYMLSFRQPDGGIYDQVLSNYNTAICLSALAQSARPDAASAIGPAQEFIRATQWSEESIDHSETGRVDPSHPFYGGIGYGGHERPDLSNLAIALEGMRDSGVASDDKAFQRALTFLARVQMSDKINDMPYADGSEQGGFIYATSPSGSELGAGESKAGLTPGEGSADVPRHLRAYGSMTYAGFKSYIYADLDRDDPRVTTAYDWIRRNYTLQENPGVGTDGMYYYFVTFARALDAWGLPYVETINPDGSEGEARDWANDLIDRLAELQNPDGSFRVIDDRWMEDNPVLITAYALLALQHAVR